YIQNGSGPHTLVIVDIDHFKSVNDNYGHQTGDVVLQEMAKMLSSGSRRGDFVGRYGGEEFCILLLNTTKENAKIYCEKIRRQVEENVFKTSKGDLNITISLGCSELNQAHDSIEQWVESADQALYSAKDKGRNQTVIAG
ncbi:MAG: GGDEF domain-containing protein, partial [Marinomonas atlantica]|nr:GGDEF domain-containing protein [Marinomonas atlantica]